MALPQNVVFDVGNVLLAWDPGDLVRDHVPDSSRHDVVLQGIFGHHDWQLLDQGRLAEEAANRRFSERTGLDLETVERLIHASKDCLSPMECGFSLLDEVEQAGAAIYCLTNMSHGTFEFLRRKFDFWDRFRGLLVSARLDLIKPDPAIFRHLLEHFGLEPDETAFLDDNPANVEGARSVGIRARVYDTTCRDWLFAGAPL